MECPQCKSQMIQNPIGGNTVDECRHCRGLWFDQGELEAVKDEVLPEMSWLDIDSCWENTDFKIFADVLNCPKCKNTDLTVVQDQASEMEIRLCRQCEGTWLATGQFLNMINALLEEANQKSAPEYVKISLQHAKEMILNPDTIISEWKGLKTVLNLFKHRFFIEHPKLKSLLAGLQKSLPL